MQYELVKCIDIAETMYQRRHKLGAFHYIDGNEEAFVFNGNLHREDAPAVIWHYENKTVKQEGYFMNDGRHNENGPAVVHYNEKGEVEYEQYFLNHIEYLKENYYKQIQTKLYW